MPTGSRYPTVDELVSGWISHFWAADRALAFREVEREVSAPLRPGVLIVGILDAIGSDFFADWKTANPRSRTDWRDKWRFNAQTLTYGWLVRALGLPGRRFTIRMAFKSVPPTYDYEWFEYTDAELDMWSGELNRIADAILDARTRYDARFLGEDADTGANHWALNPQSCLRYGAKYPCPFLHQCTHQLWSQKPSGSIERVSHLRTERDIALPDGTLLLDATRVDTWLECPEKFRRIYEQNIAEPPSEALQTGQEFHRVLAEYYRLGIEHNWNVAFNKFLGVSYPLEEV